MRRFRCILRTPQVAADWLKVAGVTFIWILPKLYLDLVNKELNPWGNDASDVGVWAKKSSRSFKQADKTQTIWIVELLTDDMVPDELD